MKYLRARLLAILAQVGLVSVTLSANAQNSPYALNRLFLEEGAATPLYKVLTFNRVTAVENYYGVTSPEAKLATDFFSGYTGSSANMLFTRYPILPARAHLYGSDVSGLTLAQLQDINGSLSISSEGYTYAASINLSSAPGFPGAAAEIQAALNQHLPVAAVTTRSSIAPVSVSFTGSINGDVLKVSALSSGSIQTGSYISGPGVPAGTQITSQVSGAPHGVGAYGLFVVEPTTPTESLTETYGVLTVGSVNSGTVAIGEQISGVTRAGSPPTAIERNLSGAGAGSTWIVNNSESVASKNLTMTGAPLSVIYQAVAGATENSGAFWIQQNGNFNYASSSLTYADGTAADALGLTQAEGAFLSSTGQIVTSASDWMNNFVQNFSDQFFSFQTPSPGGPVPGEQSALEAWAQSQGGQYQYLAGWSANTPPITGSLGAVQIQIVPEPSTWALMGLGFLGLGFVGYRRGRLTSAHARPAVPKPAQGGAIGRSGPRENDPQTSQSNGPQPSLAKPLARSALPKARDGEPSFVLGSTEAQPTRGAVHHAPVFGIDAQGSAAGSEPPFWMSSIEILSGVRINAIWPSRGGRLMVTPAALSLAHVA